MSKKMLDKYLTKNFVLINRSFTFDQILQHMPSTTAKLTGVLTDVFPVETTANFSKRIFWLKEPDTERYPQHWEIELHGRDVEQIMKVKIGDKLEVEVEVRGRQYNSRQGGGKKIFTSLKCTGMTLLERLETSEKYKASAHDKKVDEKVQGELIM